MERLTQKAPDSEMVWFKDKERLFEPCEMSAHQSRMAIAKLATYEQAEEQGLLLRLPCKVGSNIYRITDDGVDVADCREIRVADEEMYIESNTFCDWISFDKIGNTVFLTEEEAETKLKEMEGAE